MSVAEVNISSEHVLVAEESAYGKEHTVTFLGAEMVGQLIEAENRRDSRSAAALLSDRVKITRSGGVEQDRDELLAEIANPPNRMRVRHLHPDITIEESNEIMAVRSLVHVTDTDTAKSIGSYRNLHVFRRESDEWRCVMWHITKLEE